MTFYKIRKLGSRVPGGSMTEPIRGSLDVVLKQDSANSPCCVYNEIVALRLAQRLGVPLAMGVPSVGDGGTYFASLTVGGLSINLPNLTSKRMPDVARRYPSEAASIFVFDVWTLNDDRENNIKANLTAADIHLVAGIDHEQSLLGRYGDMNASLQALMNLEVPIGHPLRKQLNPAHVAHWVSQIQALNDKAIEDGVILGFNVSGVFENMQRKLAEAMKARRDVLPALVQRACT